MMHIEVCKFHGFAWSDFLGFRAQEFVWLYEDMRSKLKQAAQRRN